MDNRTLPLFALGAVLALAHPASADALLPAPQESTYDLAAHATADNPLGWPAAGSAKAMSDFNQEQILAIRTVATADLAGGACQGLPVLRDGNIRGFLASRGVNLDDVTALQGEVKEGGPSMAAWKADPTGFCGRIMVALVGRPDLRFLFGMR